VKQLLQRLDTGESMLVDAPVPSAGGHQMVVESRVTAISAGTERMLVDFGKGNWLAKARSQPDKVRQVLEKVRTDGIGPTLEAVRAKLEVPIPLGYCQAGVVVETGPRVQGFRTGDRVVTNGSHAEYVRVPHLLAARIPDGVSFESAAFTPLAAIGLQGLRLAGPTIGETGVVYGLGLIGLLTVQLLRANGCRVIGIDRHPGRLALAQSLGATVVAADAGDIPAQVLELTDGVGADFVLLTLAADSDEPVRHAASMSRKRGRLVLVGVTGLNLSRDLFYKKELSFTVSCSYGAGRYDSSYEEGGRDFPLPYVRWTEQRNFSAVLELMAQGSVDATPLITHRIPFEEAPRAYDLIRSDEPSLGVLLTYPDRPGRSLLSEQRVVHRAPPAAGRSSSVLGVIGAGNFALRILLPALKSAGFRFHTVVTSGSASGAVAGEKFGFERVATDARYVLEEPTINAVVVATRHDSHAELARQALEAGKHVFVEKPLALTEDELDRLAAAAAAGPGTLMVGFNRRFAPLTTRCLDLLRGRAGPLGLVATMNAGSIPRDHWIQDPAAGGGRIVGEACHLIDLARALVGSPITSLHGQAALDRQGAPIDDIATLGIRFGDGSVAGIHYLANGARAYPKERVDCFFDGKTLVIDNWRRLRTFGIRGGGIGWPARMDKGHVAEIRAWALALRGDGPAPIPLEELLEVSRWSIRAGELIRRGV